MYSIVLLIQPTFHILLWTYVLFYTVRYKWCSRRLWMRRFRGAFLVVCSNAFESWKKKREKKHIRRRTNERTSDPLRERAESCGEMWCKNIYRKTSALHIPRRCYSERIHIYYVHIWNCLSKCHGDAGGAKRRSGNGNHSNFDLASNPRCAPKTGWRTRDVVIRIIKKTHTNIAFSACAFVGVVVVVRRTRVSAQFTHYVLAFTSCLGYGKQICTYLSCVYRAQQTETVHIFLFAYVKTQMTNPPCFALLGVFGAQK